MIPQNEFSLKFSLPFSLFLFLHLISILGLRIYYCSEPLLLCLPSRFFFSSGHRRSPGTCLLLRPGHWFESELLCSYRPCAWSQLMANWWSELIVWVFELVASEGVGCSFLTAKARWSMIAAGSHFSHHVLAASLEEQNKLVEKAMMRQKILVVPKLLVPKMLIFKSLSLWSSCILPFL